MDTEYEGSWRKANDFFARPTGTWAERTPEISLSKCGQCGLCVIYCPTGCIFEKEEHFLVNLEYCKGCGVCAKECPSKAITMLEKKL